MNNEPELAPKEEWLASFGGFRVIEHPYLANGWIELRDEQGNPIARVGGVKSIMIAKKQL